MELVFPDILWHEDLELLMAVDNLAEASSFLGKQFYCLLVLEQIVDLEALENLPESHLHKTKKLSHSLGLEDVGHSLCMLGKLFNQWVLISLFLDCTSKRAHRVDIVEEIIGIITGSFTCKESLGPLELVDGSTKHGRIGEQG